MDAVPAKPQRRLVRLQLARVKESEKLEPGEARREQALELGGRVLVYVPGVVRARRPRRGEREAIRGAHVNRAARVEERREALQQLPRVFHVLHRLQEDHGVVRSAIVELLNESSLEGKARTSVLAVGVLERLGVGLDANHLRGGIGEHRGAITLAARHVEHAHSAAALGDPAIDGEVAPVPVVLLRDVGQRALAGQLERRHSRGLVTLQVPRLAHARNHSESASSRPFAPVILPATVSRDAPTAKQIKDVNLRYHDAAADSYDSKWGIDYGDVGRRQVLMKLTKALGKRPGHYRRALEVGAGTGYFSLNLLRAGVIGEATATDISDGMLRRLSATASTLGVEVETVRSDAERLPFADGHFDLVLGHAVLHHLPALDHALAEFNRVLAPGGTIAFMGEPSRYGDRIAAVPKRIGILAAPAWRRLVGAPSSADGNDADAEDDGHRLEPWVDVHVFSPGELRTMAARAGFTEVRISGEELVASAYGWLLRSLQADSDPEEVPRGWHQFAFRSYLALQWLDGNVLESRLPPGLFYNLLLSGRKPG